MEHEQSLNVLIRKEVGRGGGDRKQQREEFQGLTRNAEKHSVIEKEQ
jgi:hypothetical protein